MKRPLALILCITLMFMVCSSALATEQTAKTISETAAEEKSNDLLFADSVPEVFGMNDPTLLEYLEDSIYAELEAQLDDGLYRIDSVSAVFISQEYVTELVYNSQSNVYFGWTLTELDEMFQGTRYVFTLGDDGQTTVQELVEIPDTTNATILKNITMGTGVILLCVVISSVSGGLGAPTCAAVFAAGAKSGTVMALSSGSIGAFSAGIVRGIETGDMGEALEAAALAGSQGYKIGAITGTISGSAAKAIQITRANASIPKPRQSELDVLKESQQKYKNASEQVSYLGGKEVPYGTAGSTRPDVVIPKQDGTVHAIEVKNYDLKNNLNVLMNNLEKQVDYRSINLPPGSTQEIVLETRGRKYTDTFLKDVVSEIQNKLDMKSPGIAITLMQ